MLKEIEAKGSQVQDQPGLHTRGWRDGLRALAALAEDQGLVLSHPRGGSSGEFVGL